MTDERPALVVTEVTLLGGRLVQVRFRLHDGEAYRVVVPRSVATFDNVEWIAHALASLQAAQRLPR